MKSPDLKNYDYCYQCGRITKAGDRFCNKKHEAAYKREKERSEYGREGKRSGY